MICHPVRTDPDAKRLFARWSATQQYADSMRAQGRLEPAEELEARAEQLLRQLYSPERPCDLLVGTDADGYSTLTPPDIAAAAAWLLDITFMPTQLAQLLTPSQLASCETLLREINSALLDPRDQTTAELTTVLQTGLERKIGTHVVGPAERVYLFLVATGATVGKVRVCERCHLVFESRRARQCDACRRNPPRPTPRSWHDAIALPDRRPTRSRHALVMAPGRTFLALRQLAANTRTTYAGRCGCGDTFVSHDARCSHCEKCATPAARTRRHRARRAQMSSQ